MLQFYNEIGTNAQGRQMKDSALQNFDEKSVS
jgi:hypothetical protein